MFNLTGVWHGIYNYRDRRPPTSFVAVLSDIGDLLGGTVEEPRDDGGPTLEIVTATIDGRRTGRDIQFLKRYISRDPIYGLVDYQGTLSPDGLEIHGTWTIWRHSTGTFLMIRFGCIAADATEGIAAKV